MTAHVFTTQFIEYFKPLLRLTAQTKKSLSNILLLIDNAPAYLRGSDEEVQQD